MHDEKVQKKSQSKLKVKSHSLQIKKSLQVNVNINLVGTYISHISAAFVKQYLKKISYYKLGT